MTETQLKYTFNQFEHNAKFVSFEELNSGHINDTYLIKTEIKPYFILQQINHKVFKDVPSLIANKVKISQHLQQKMSHLSDKELKRRVLSFIKVKDGNYYYKDKIGNYWNMMLYIDQSKTFEIVTDKKISYEGGELFGEFLNMTSDFDATQLVEVLPKFHDMSFRFSQFEDAKKNATIERLEKAKSCIVQVEGLREEMYILQHLKDTGKIQLRVTHNDTKISNALFDMNNKGLCVIDTDTVMPGIVHYDFGDAIRTICNTANEDEKKLNLVNFNMSFYRAYVEGFLSKIGVSLSKIELENLPLGAKTITFIMALRFLTDYLNGNIYYKIAYLEHNLDRTKNQLKLVHCITDNFQEMKKAVATVSQI